MSTKLVRISAPSHRKLAMVARQKNKTMVEAMDDVIQGYERDKFWQDVEAGYGYAQAKPAEWLEELSERNQLEGTLMDGLKDEGCYNDPRVAKYVSRTSAKRSGTNSKASARRSS